MIISGLGAFIRGEVIGQLVLVLALGTVGTPFAIAIVLYLLNSDAVAESASMATNLGGIALFVVSGTLAANFLREQLAGGINALSGAVLTFAIVLGVATFVLAFKYAQEEMSIV